MHDPFVIEIITYTATVARTAWEPHWVTWKLDTGYPGPLFPASKDACIPSSFALCAILRVMAPEYSWQVCGGRPTKRTPLGGYAHPSGRRGRAHLWVEGRGAGGDLVVDVTADQFGGERVIVGAGARHTANATRRLLERYEEGARATVAQLYDAFDKAMAARRPSCCSPA